MKPLFRLLSFSASHGLRILATLLSLLTITLLSLIVPRLIRDVIDVGLRQGDAALIGTIGLALIGIATVRALLNFVKR